MHISIPFRISFRSRLQTWGRRVAALVVMDGPVEWDVDASVARFCREIL